MTKRDKRQAAMWNNPGSVRPEELNILHMANTTNKTGVARQVERYMALPYSIELTPDGDGGFVSIPDLPGCISQGNTPEEALEMIREVQQMWLQVAIEDGERIPHPSNIKANE